MACALGARVDVPRLSLHKVLSPGGVADGGRAELWLLHLEVIWGTREDPNTGNDPAAVSPAGEEPGAVGFEGQRRRAGGSYPEDGEENIPCTEIQGRRAIFQEMVRVCQHGMTESVETIKLQGLSLLKETGASWGMSVNV